MSLTEVIKQLETEYKNIIDSFSVVDENDPITPENLKKLSKQLFEWNKSLNNSLILENNLQDEFNFQVQELKKSYEKDIETFQDNLKIELKTVSASHKDKIKELRKQIEADKIDFDKALREREIDKEIYINTSEQNKMFLSSDFEDAKKRLDFQKDKAKDSYVLMVDKYNGNLVKIRQRLKSNYEKTVNEFINDYDNIIAKLNSLIENKTYELNSLNSILKNERNEMKGKYLQESKNLNNDIKKISDEKNRTIDKAKNTYAKSIGDSNIEKENKRQSYQVNTQTLLKEFITKISEIDENISKEKKEFEEIIDKEKRELQYSLFELTRKYHDDITHLKSLDIPEKNKLIKVKTKEYHRQINEIRRASKQNVYKITHENVKTIEDYKNSKSYLEIDKNFAVKRLFDQEQHDNKYYQIISGTYENDMTYAIKLANHDFNQKANLIRCQSQIRNKLLERNFDNIEANYYKKIEKLQSIINYYKLEITLAQNLKEIDSDLELKKYYNDLHYEEVINLLEIEKNKLLDEFNETSYNFNIKLITQDMDYGYKKIDLQNENYKTICNLNDELDSLILEKKVTISSISIKNEQLIEKQTKLRTQLIHNNNIKKHKLEYNTDLHEADIKYMLDYNQLLAGLLNNLQSGHIKVIQNIYHKINPTTSNVKYLETFYNRFYHAFIDCYNDIITEYSEKIKSIIKNRLKFIENFKYFATYNSLRKNFLREQTNYKEKISQLLDKIDSNKKTIENFKQRIFNLVNNNEMLLQSAKGKKRKLEEHSQNIYKANQLKIKEYRDKIEIFNEEIKLFDVDVLEYNKLLRNSKKQHEKALTKIENMQNRDSIHYLNLQKDVNNLLLKLKFSSSKVALSGDIKDSKDKNLNFKIIKSQHIFYTLLKNTKEDTLKIINKFIDKNKSEYDIKSRQIQKEIIDSAKAFSNRSLHNRQEFEKNSINQMNMCEENIKNQNIKIEETKINFEKLLELANENYQKNGVYLKEQKEITTNDFFNKYYALLANYDAITKHHDDNRKSAHKEYNRLKNQHMRWIIIQKQEANKKLYSLIQAKNEEIQHLPIAYKYNTNLLNKETKIKNNDINLLKKDAKAEYNASRKVILKKLNSLENQYEQSKIHTDILHQKNIKIEKRQAKIQLKQSLRKIEH